MKKSIIALSLAALSLSASAVYAADGTINFTGSVTTDACTVDTASASQTVALGKVSPTSFKAAGDVASPTKFTIKLTTCPASVSSAAVRFDGTPNATDSRLLSLSSGQTAAGLAVAIYESDSKTIIPLHTASTAITLDSKKAINEMSYVAKYMSTAASVTAGGANASTNFTISYN